MNEDEWSQWQKLNQSASYITKYVTPQSYNWKKKKLKDEYTKEYDCKSDEK